MRSNWHCTLPHEKTNHKLRVINPSSIPEIELIACRMRETLIEVLGDRRGEAMYSIEWLKDRVMFHLDPARSTGQVFVAENETGEITGHFIVRIEQTESGESFGLGSTIYVVPVFRRRELLAPCS